jgi:hypothetical protein
MTPFNKVKYDKTTETDRQMLLRIGKKFVLLFFLIFMFDTVLDLFSGLIDLIIELLHIGIEAVEYSIELLLEHIFHSNHQQSEMIIVNIAIILALYGFYRFCLVLPRLYKGFKNKIKTVWLSRKQSEVECWCALSLNRQIKVGLTYLVGIFSILFILTI